MTYEIVRIDNLEKSQSKRSRGFMFRRICLKPEDYEKSGKFYFCDVVKGFRNEKNWKRIFEKGIGIQIRNVRLKGNDHVDADSFPIIVDGGNHA